MASKVAALPDTLDPDISESAFGKLVEQCATENGWLWTHTTPLPTPAGRRKVRWITPSAPGFPDYLMLHPECPTQFVLEIKSRTGTVEPEQRRWLNAFARLRNCHVATGWPEDWPEIRRYLETPSSVTQVEESPPAV